MLKLPDLGIFSSAAKVSQFPEHQLPNKRDSTLHTGLFVSPSGISDPCGTVAGRVTPKGNMSTEGETLQVSVLPYRFSICAPLVTRQMSIL